MGRVEEQESEDDGQTDSGNALLAEDPDQTNYDEEQWERAMTVVPPASAEGGLPSVDVDDAGQSDQAGPLPRLDDLVKTIPQTSRDLIDSLFRGQFTNVKVIDRKKLL